MILAGLNFRQRGEGNWSKTFEGRCIYCNWYGAFIADTNAWL